VIVRDHLYGPTRIEEPLLAALVDSRPVQRLKGVTMGGIVALLGLSPATTRYEHSVGAMLLVRRFGGTVEEQAAALLHDVSHTALSHVVDYVFDRTAAQDFHDEHKTDYVHRTDLPEICARHGVDVGRLLDETLFPLLEQPSPRLCADRIDYTLRDLEPLGIAGARNAAALAGAVVTVDGRMAFADVASAERFGRAYLDCARLSWANPRHSALYELSGRALRTAFDEGAIDRQDFWRSDRDLWRRIETYGRTRPDVADILKLIDADTRFVASSGGRPGLRVRTKVRWIDPDVAVDGAPVRLSALSPDYARTLARYRQTTAESLDLEAA